MKRRIKELSRRQQIDTLDALYTAASAIKGRDAVKLFLRDLLTTSERVMLGRRILIARYLMSGSSHRDIEKELGVGRDTVQRVQKWLEDQIPGYERAIQAMEREFDTRLEKYRRDKLYASSTIFRLKKKYPLYYLLFPSPSSKKSQ